MPEIQKIPSTQPLFESNNAGLLNYRQPGSKLMNGWNILANENNNNKWAWNLAPCWVLLYQFATAVQAVSRYNRLGEFFFLRYRCILHPLSISYCSVKETMALPSARTTALSMTQWNARVSLLEEGSTVADQQSLSEWTRKQTAAGWCKSVFGITWKNTGDWVIRDQTTGGLPFR